jgi:hypothetical protein
MRTSTFACHVARIEVMISQTFEVGIGSNGEEWTRGPFGMTCGRVHQCTAVATHHGASTTLDWAQCAFWQRRGA